MLFIVLAKGLLDLVQMQQAWTHKEHLVCWRFTVSTGLNKKCPLKDHKYPQFFKIESAICQSLLNIVSWIKYI
jgi:hypothetical protein